jgi:hypothetical protein
MIAAAVLVAASTGAAASPLVVAVIRPGDDDPVMTEAAGRTAAELTAAGMRAMVVACTDSFDSRCPAPDLPEEPRDAVVAISRAQKPKDGGDGDGDGDGATIQVEVTGTRTRSGLRRRLEVSLQQGGDDPSVLAIRAVELLRATQMQMATRAAPPAKPPDHHEEPAPPARPSDRGGGSLGLALGAALLQSLGGFGSAFTPEARITLRPYQALGFEARWLGPTFAPDLTAAEGSVTLRQELLDVGATYALRSGGPLVPTASVRLGLYHLEVAGHAATPERALTGALWAAELAAGVGVMLLLRAEYTLRFDAEAVFVDPSASVAIGRRVFPADRPLLLFGLTVERGFSGVPFH